MLERGAPVRLGDWTSGGGRGVLIWLSKDESVCVYFFLEGELRGRELLVYMGTLWLNRGLFLVDGGSSWCDQKILGNHDFELDVSCMKDISGDSWIVLARKFLIIYPDNLKGK